MNREDLLKHVNIAIDVAKQDLMKQGKVLPVLVMTFPDKPMIIAPVPEKKIVPLILRRENPDAFTYTVEIWIRNSEQAERRDAVQVVAGTGPTRMISNMEFRKQNDKVMFNKVRFMTDEELDNSIVDMGLHDGILGEILGVWAPAPPGGRLFHVRRDGYNIWIPEGWRMGTYLDDKDPQKQRLSWWRAKDPHGAVRVTRYWNNSGKPVEPLMEARREAEIRRGKGAENIEIQQNATSATVTWSQIIQVPNATAQRGLFWQRVEKSGAMFVSFIGDAKTGDSDIQEEISLAREIASRIVLF